MVEPGGIPLAVRLVRRAFVAVEAPVAALAALWTLVVALIATSLLRVPNADPALDGDPCCAYPDTWGDVALGVFSLAALALVGHQITVAALPVASVVCAFAVPVVWAVAANV
jgi:hypothetical protein